MSGPDPGQVQIVTLDPALAIVMRRTWPMSQLREAQQQASAALRDVLGERPAGRRLTIWRMPDDGRIDYAPGFLVSERLPVSDPLSIVDLPEGRAAHLTMMGGFDGLPAAWGRLFERCEALGLALAGLNWEVYPSADQPQEIAQTDLYAALA